MTTYIEITEDRAKGGANLVPVLSMGEIYLNAYPKPGEVHLSYPKSPIDLVWNRNSCLLQNKQTVSKSHLYDEYYYRSGLNSSMVEHLREVVRLAVKSVELENGDVVIDIASNDGTLLRHYRKETDREICTVGYDPALNLAEEAAKGVTRHFPILFNATHCEASGYDKAKIITACAVVYHLPDPIEFLKQVKQCLHPEGVFVCEFSYLPTAMKNNAFDMIGHEHTTHLSLTSFEKMLDYVELEIVSAELGDINSGTILCVLKHKPSFEYRQFDGAWLQALRHYESALGMDRESLYLKWAHQGVVTMKKLLDTLTRLRKQGKSVYLYGASTKASILLQWIGADNTMIQKAVERNEWKVGREMVGLKIPIISEEQARKENPDVMWIGPWCFKEGFIKREREYLKAGGKMLFPLPQLEIVDGSYIK